MHAFISSVFLLYIIAVGVWK